jgi:hypothetical protein
MIRLAAIVLLGACTSPRGALEVRVMPPDDQTELATVRLFVGMKKERRGDLRPPGYLAPISAVWWERDRAPAFDDQAVGKPDPDGGYLVRYALAEGGQDAVSALLAVGYDAEHAPRAFGSYLDRIEIPDGEILQYEMALSTRFTWLPRAGIDALPGVQVWSRLEDRFACAQVDNMRFIETHGAAIIGPHNDMDCDGLVDGDPTECVSSEYMGQVPFESRADLTCVTSELAPATSDLPAVEVLVAGGLTCEDGYGNDPNRCSRSSYCLPAAFPKLCERFDCDPFAGNTVIPSYLSCELDARIVAGGGLEFCENPVTAALAPQLPVTCGGAPALRDRNGPFATKIDTLRYDIEVAATVTSCAFELTPRGLTQTSVIPALLAVPLTAPVDGRGLVLPVKFTVRELTECPNTQILRLCQLVLVPESSGESLHRCLTTPVTSGTTVNPKL